MNLCPNQSHIDEFTTGLIHIGDDRKVDQLFHATSHCLMMDQWGPKHVAVDVLQHNCNSNELCAFGVSRCVNWIMRHGMENLKSEPCLFLIFLPTISKKVCLHSQWLFCSSLKCHTVRNTQYDHFNNMFCKYYLFDVTLQFSTWLSWYLHSSGKLRSVN
jgi:hypothetical protein